jgi:hypothetical protein
MQEENFKIREENQKIQTELNQYYLIMVPIYSWFQYILGSNIFLVPIYSWFQYILGSNIFLVRMNSTKYLFNQPSRPQRKLSN